MRVTFFPDFSEGNPYQRELKDHLEERGLSIHLDGELRSSRRSRQLLPLLGKYHDSSGPDVIHLHWIHPFFANDNRVWAVLGGLRLVFELLILRLLGVRVVWTIHNLIDHDHRLPERLEVAFRHVVFRLCDRAIVHCDRAAETVIETYRLPAAAGRKMVTIPHGHYIDSYPNDVDREQARADLQLADGETAFLYFGRIRPYKNVPGLVSAFERIDRDDVRLLIVGSPRSEAIADDIAARCDADDRIREIFGFVSEEEVQTYMNAADAVVLPFNDVLTSGSAMLAMSFGRPVVVPALGCVATLVPDELTYDPTEPDGLTRALERVMVEDTRVLGRRSRRIATQFDWEPIAARTAAVYREAGA